MIKINSIPSGWKLLISILICQLTGIISGLLSDVGNNAWFNSLNKPTWNPPDYIFGPVWTFLYLLIGVALWLIWKSSVQETRKKNAECLFATQLFLNFWWSILFFKFHSPMWAFIDIVLMILLIIITIFKFASISKPAAWLLVPYISWVCFAAILNYTIYSIN